MRAADLCYMAIMLISSKYCTSIESCLRGIRQIIKVCHKVAFVRVRIVSVFGFRKKACKAHVPQGPLISLHQRGG